MLRKAVTRQCSVISPVAVFSSTGETVPQKGQTSACFAGFHCASPPHAGQLNFFCAVTSDIAKSGGGYFSAEDSCAATSASIDVIATVYGVRATLSLPCAAM